jgi:hypothetical protein
MNDWTDAEISTLIADAMTAHEDDVDADRARELAFGVEPSRRHWPAVMAASVAVIVVGGVALYVAVRSGDDAAAPATTGPTSGGDTTATSVPGTTAENRQLAIAASEAALASMPVPEGSVELNGKPDGWPGGSMGLGPADWRLGRTAWWSVPLSVDEVVAFLTENAPAGMRRPEGEEVVPDGNSDGVGYTDYSVISPAEPAAYTGPSLLVQFKQIGDNTVLRLDTFLAARYAVSPQHRITGEVSAVQIVRVRPGKPFGSDDGGPLPTVRLEEPADAALINKLVDSFNGLYGSAADVAAMGCPFPGDPAPEDTVTFFVRNDDGTDGTVVAKAELACWGQVQVTVGGTRLQVSLDPGEFPQTVDEVAGAAS